MTSIALASVKHSPGVTTAAVALAAAAGADAVVVEADPSGGDVAARARLALEPGLLTLAAAARHPMTPLDLPPHAQPLPAGGSVVVAPAAPELAASAVATVASRLPQARGAFLVLIDCGRLVAGSPAEAAVRGADALVVVTEPTVAAVEHLRARLLFLRDLNESLSLLLVGDRPYGPGEIGATLGVPVAGVLAVNPRAVAAVYAGGGAARSLLVRSARSTLDGLLAARAGTEEVTA